LELICCGPTSPCSWQRRGLQSLFFSTVKSEAIQQHLLHMHTRTSPWYHNTKQQQHGRKVEAGVPAHASCLLSALQMKRMHAVLQTARIAEQCKVLTQDQHKHDWLQISWVDKHRPCLNSRCIWRGLPVFIRLDSTALGHAFHRQAQALPARSASALCACVNCCAAAALCSCRRATTAC
jgi:hypothetical protein